MDEIRNLNLPENEEAPKLPNEPPIDGPPEDDLVHSVNVGGKDRNIPPKDEELNDKKLAELGDDEEAIRARLDEVQTQAKALRVERVSLLLHLEKIGQRLQVHVKNEVEKIRNNRPLKGGN